MLGGRPLLIQTARVFDIHPSISSIVIAVPEAGVEEVRELCSTYGLGKIDAVVSGGRNRQESVWRGLEAVPSDISIVLTHDAVRPFISADEISKLIEAVRRTGAAAIAAPVTDTLVGSQDGNVAANIPREGVFRMLTPQGFDREVLEKAHRRADAEREVFTDEVTLVRSNGQSVCLVEGSVVNIKITTQADWDLTEWMWPAWEKR